MLEWKHFTLLATSQVLNAHFKSLYSMTLDTIIYMNIVSDMQKRKFTAFGARRSKIQI